MDQTASTALLPALSAVSNLYNAITKLEAQAHVAYLESQQANWRACCRVYADDRDRAVRTSDRLADALSQIVTIADMRVGERPPGSFAAVASIARSALNANPRED
jgi:hypothetical protein